MNTRRPRAIITRSSGDLTSAEAAVVRVAVCLSVCGDHDSVQVIAWPTSKLADLAPGDEIAVALGEEDDEELVWTGQVIDHRICEDGLVIEGLAPTTQLSSARVCQTYLSQTIADIVTELAGDVDTDEIQCDTTLDAYTVDNHQSAWAHILDLARLVDGDVGCSAPGGLRFVPAESSGQEKSLRYGADLISWRVGPSKSPEAMAIAPLRSSSESGSDKWHWIAKAPSTSGSTDNGVKVVGSFGTRDAADQLQEALGKRAQRKQIRGWVRSVGAPDIRPGDQLTLEDLPDADPGGLRILSITHILDGGSGFVSHFEVEGIGGGQ
ncbi:MAG: hypothetical protein GY847_09080 [Proteobacteria bacterium]|nr:hypothetical protein [Pseudomonadota bacterium]